MDVQQLQHVYYALGILVIVFGTFWRFHLYHVKAKEAMKDDFDHQLDKLETRVNSVEVRQAQQGEQIGSVREMLAEVRTDIKTLLAKV